MSKKHFVALAAAIAKITDADARRSAAEAVANACTELAPKFNRNTFLKACGVVQ